MVFSILILIMVLLVAFFHYIQNFFSATLSAIFAILAAAVAISFHENVVAMLKPGKLADSATAVVLCSMFALTYVVLRLVFDRAVPGNIRLQSTIDKVGAAVMGLIAGIFTGGIFAIAVQTMPFGPSILGWSRYALAPDRKDISFLANPAGRGITRDITDEMKSEHFKPEDQNNLLLPVDNIVMSTVGALSEGSLSGVRPVSAIHDDYLQEAFGPRAGLEVGAKHTAANFEGQSQISVQKVFLKESLRQVEDSELPELRGKKEARRADANETTAEAKLAKADLKPVKADGTSPAPNGVLVIVRMSVDKNATDEKGDLFLFSTGSVRLVTHDKDTGKAKDYFALGTMDFFNGGTFWPSHVSDPLFIDNKSSEGADVVFSVENRDELVDAASGPPPKKGEAARPATGEVRQGVFLEVKRLARVNLGGMPIEGNWTSDPKFQVLRKVRMRPEPPPAPAPQ